MSSAETLPRLAYDQEQQPPLDAEQVQAEVAGRRLSLESDGSLEDAGLVEPSLAYWGRTGKHEVFGVDISDQLGGAFKYASAYGALLDVPEGTHTVVTVSAGNFAGTLACAARNRGMHAIALTPDDLSDQKRAVMEANGMDVNADYPSVAEAVPAAVAACEENEGWAFVHPFDNPNGIAALTALTDRVVGQLVESHADLSDRPVKVLVQRGGGSLITAMALSVQTAKAAGVLGENVSVMEVRPEPLEDGSLDPLFDGLRVDEPGSYAKPVLDDPRYVAGTHYTSQAAVADAARRVAQVSRTAYESNALVGLAAAADLATTDTEPTLYVTLLTGRNITEEQHDALLALPGKEKAPQPAPQQRKAVGSALLSGMTAAHRATTLDPAYRRSNPALYTPDPEAVADYRRQLQEMGIELLPGSYI